MCTAGALLRGQAAVHTHGSVLGGDSGVAAGGEAVHQLGVVVRMLRQLVEVHVLQAKATSSQQDAMLSAGS